MEKIGGGSFGNGDFFLEIFFGWYLSEEKMGTPSRNGENFLEFFL